MNLPIAVSPVSAPLAGSDFLIDFNLTEWYFSDVRETQLLLPMSQARVILFRYIEARVPQLSDWPGRARSSVPFRSLP